MEAIRDVGVIEHFKGLIHWRIPNFYDLPQECNTVIRSPHFHYRDSDWYMEVYPDGRRLYSSSGWFGIGALNLNSESNLPIVSLGVVLAPNKNYVLSAEKSHGDGFYCCTRLLPISILKSWLDLFVPEGDLYVLCCIENEIDDYEADMLLIQLKTDDVQKWFQKTFEIAGLEQPSAQVEVGNEIQLVTDVGEVSKSSDPVEWTIPNFCDLPQEYDTIIRSPRFRYEDSDWYLEVYPNGRSLYSSFGWFGIGVLNVNSDSNVRDVRIWVSVSPNKNPMLLKASSNGNGFYCCTKLLPTSLLNSKRDFIGPSGNLRLLFDTDTDTMDDGELLMQLSKENVLKWYKQYLENAHIEMSTQTEQQNGVEKLRQDFQEMLINGSVSDIVLKVEGKEFRAHKFILAARSPVFLAMMTHDTKEKIDGVVEIPDVDPYIFPDFLHYLYTGRFENLTSENAAKLYTTADKYQVNELKESCKNLMLTNISIDNFCDIFTLSFQHNEKELREACIQFFTKNSLEIVLSCKWQIFLSENPIVGNELFIKHLKLNK